MFLGREIMASGIAGKLGVDKGEMRRESLRSCVIWAQLSKSCDAPTPELSDGQRQTIAVARAMK
jgi:ABC-type phosphate transport system ATPase subunit